MGRRAAFVISLVLLTTLLAQRREMDPKKRKQIYVPSWPPYVAHPPYVKGFRHHEGYGLGMRLLHTWLDK